MTKNDTDKKRNSGRYRKWRETVYARDSYTCQKCGKQDDLQAHHQKEWKNSPDLRYDVSNGITLCKTCHENIHGAQIPRVRKHYAPVCEKCGNPTKGHSIYCRGCALSISHKAKLQRQSLVRDKFGHYTSCVVEPL